MIWLKRFYSRNRRYDDIAISIREHVDERTEELMEDGMPREEAAKKARREFGNVTVIAERSRQVWQWPTLESIWADVRFSLHQLRKSPGFAITAILTLALGCRRDHGDLLRCKGGSAGFAPLQRSRPAGGSVDHQ